MAGPLRNENIKFLRRTPTHHFIQQCFQLEFHYKRQKISFDMITNISEESSSDVKSKYDKHTIVLSKMMDDKKGIKYQDLKSIFLTARNKQKREAKRKQIIKKK